MHLFYLGLHYLAYVGWFFIILGINYFVLYGILRLIWRKVKVETLERIAIVSSLTLVIIGLSTGMMQISTPVLG
jgi:hypothetical protein